MEALVFNSTYTTVKQALRLPFLSSDTTKQLSSILELASEYTDESVVILKFNSRI